MLFSSPPSSSWTSRFSFAMTILMALLWSASCLNIPNSDRHSVNLATDLDEIENGLRATVAFTSPDADRIFCSGFFISPTRIISAAHCFEISFGIMMPDGNVLQVPSAVSIVGTHVSFIRYGDMNLMTNALINPPQQATVVYSNHEEDFTILDISEGTATSEHFFDISETDPRIGEQAFGIGHPYRLAWSFETGIISRVVYNVNPENVLLLQASVPVAGGNSGGPLLNARGEIIGMAVGFVDRLPHLAIFISADKIRSEIRNFRVEQLILAFQEHERLQQEENARERNEADQHPTIQEQP